MERGMIIRLRGFAERTDLTYTEGSKRGGKD